MDNVEIKSNVKEVLEGLDDAVERALVACGIVAEGHAKFICPVDTGRLRGSIVYATSTQHSTGEEPAEAGDYTPHGTPPKGEVQIGTNVEYAPAVELGTSKRKRKAKPFLRPALENHIKEYERVITAELDGGS